MKPSTITATLGIVLIGLGIYLLINKIHIGAAIPILIGGSLVYNAFRGGRVATLIFGHVCIVVGAYMITWGMLLPPVSDITVAHIIFRPLFWGNIFHNGRYMRQLSRLLPMRDKTSGAIRDRRKLWGWQVIIGRG